MSADRNAAARALTDAMDARRLAAQALAEDRLRSLLNNARVLRDAAETVIEFAEAELAGRAPCRPALTVIDGDLPPKPAA